MAILPIKVKTTDIVAIEDSTPITKKAELLSFEFIKKMKWNITEREREMWI